jgi:hypothetical protein
MRDHNEFEFEFEIVATVGVRAQSENHALEVVCSVLGAPSKDRQDRSGRT